MDGVDDEEEEEIIGVDVAVAGSTDSAVFGGAVLKKIHGSG